MSGASWRFELRIALRADLTDDRLDELMDVADDVGWTLSRDPLGVAIVAYQATATPVDRLRQLWDAAALWVAEQGLSGFVAAGDVMDDEVYEAEALRPDTPELLSATDVAELLGVSRQRVHQLHSEHADFPAPYARLSSGPIWTRPVVEAFDQAWTRKPGRPAKAG